MIVQNNFDIIAQAKKEFDFWVRNKPINFKCLQFSFPFVDTDKEITTWIFYLYDKDVNQYFDDGITITIIEKFKELLSKNKLPIEEIESMLFKIDSHENVENNFEGNYFYRLR